MEINAEQRRAVEAQDGPVAIIAGPGTGKTKTLVERLHFLIAKGVPASQLLALTFTKKSAGEMTARFGNAKVTPHISTFHALCFELLSQKRGQVPRFITDSARFSLLKSLAKPVEFKGRTVRELGLLISRAKNGAEDSPNLTRLASDYNSALAALGLSDFDDLLLQTRDLLVHDTAWRTLLQARFSHILIDEFQDTNALQYELLQLLRGSDNLFVIGDPLQSIYGFRGAAGDIFGTFMRDFPQALTLTLRTNYRSAKTVVHLANAVYPEAPALVAHSQATGEVSTTEVLNEYSEAAWILREIQQAIGGSDLLHAVSTDHRDEQLGLADIAVVYRNRTAARVLQKQLESSGIPFQVVGDGSPYETPAVQTIIQLFAQASDPERKAIIKDLTSLQIEAVTEQIDPTTPPHDAAVKLVGRFGFELTGTFQQFLGVLVRFKTVNEATAYFDDIATQGFYDARADAVTLLTIHAAKGLEFARVFLVGAEDGILPNHKGELAEEKRLFYVAVTRAKQRLDITYTRSRGGKSAAISPFIISIDESILPRHRDPALESDMRRAHKRYAKRSQTALF
ncbi:MAG TPA: ATP-dependent helicase [Magnetospirillaceae bacterium]|nr:ATP-dependent helicase [Magnetospirillaceae bacterium]